jgi:predicted RNase H-like HicB family nuclease
VSGSNPAARSFSRSFERLDGTAMKHYIAVIVPHAEVGWRAYFPDLPRCRAEAQDVEIAIARASDAASELVGRMLLNGGAPTPRTLEEIRADEAWAAERSIDWTTALISVVHVSLPK